MTDKARNWFYALSALAAGASGVLVLLGIIDQNTALTFADLVKSLGGLLGVAAPATAAVVLGNQRKNGTLETTEELSPADKVITGIQDTIDVVTSAQAEFDRAKDAVTTALGTITAGGIVDQFLKARR